MPILLAISVLAVLIIVHESGHFIAARAQGITVTRFSIGFGPVLWKYQGKETEYALRAIPLGGYVAFPDDELDEEIAADDPGLLKNRPVLDRAIVISAGVIANLIFAYLLMLTQLGWVGIPELQPQPGVLVSEIAQDVSSAAAQAGLKAKDVVIGVNGKTLDAGMGAVQSLMSVIKESPNKAVNLDVQRGDQVLSLFVTPKSTADQVPRIGVKLGPNGTVIRKKATSIPKLFGTAAAEFQSVVIQTVQGFGQLITHFQETATQVSGPVAIVAIGADIARTDVSRLLQFGALISINLAVINILPLPALDGGQLVFLIVEAFRGKPLPDEVQQGVMQTGLFLLLGLGMFLIVRDTANLSWVQNLLPQ
jgi:membrane-associated protease RseP (regulator of RpoE activity)